MRGREKALEVLSSAVGYMRHLGVEGEASWSAYREATMRSAWGEVHQTPIAQGGTLKIELRDGLRVASVSLASCTPQLIKEAVRQCAALLPEVPENPYLPDLLEQPDHLPEEEFALQDVLDVSDDLSVKERAFVSFRKASSGTDLLASARFFTATSEIGIANTLGLARYYTAQGSSLALVVTGAGGLSSYANRSAAVPSAIDFQGAIEEAFTRARLMQKLPFLDPFSDGRGTRQYDTVFAHYAVGAWLFPWLAWFEFSGLQVLEQGSYLAGKKPGDVVTGPKVTIFDDWQHADVIPLPFDFEGRTRQALSIIERGTYQGVPYDGMTAKKTGTASTGHAVGHGPMPTCLVFEGGSDSFDALVASSDRPTIVATYFNYPSMPDPREAVFTATTRHGTFLGEDGTYKAVCPPLRLRIRSFQALERIDGMTPVKLFVEQENYGMYYPTSVVVPAMRLCDIDFVGSNPTGV